jgi:hypothetical protein
VAIRFDYLRDGRQVSWRLLLITPALLAIAVLQTVSPARAQYPVQMSKPQDTQNMRAVGVLEWTGDEQHPKASRMVPVTVYDGKELQDAGIFLARPAPLALSGETEYELKDNGKTVGLFDINGAGQEQGSWVGFGVWKPVSKPKPVAQAARPAKVDSWGDDAQSERPVLHRKAGSGSGSSTSDSGSGAGGQAPQDPDRPTLHKKDSSDSSDSSTASTSSSTASDPDRPTLHKKTSSDSTDNSGDSTGTSSSGSASDPDRPTLHKKTSDDDSASGTAPTDPDRPKLKKSGGAKSPPADVGYVESLPNISDPDRPKLQRGKVNAEGLTVLPTLMGLPPDMHQEVAVSDAKSRPEHLWSYSWANPDDEGKMKADMEDLARKALGLTPPPAPPAPRRTTATSVHRKTAPPPPPPAPAPLLDEQFRVFELAYGSGATMVLSAHTDGQGAKQKFVTLVAQPDLYGNVVVLLKSVTDAAHLDDTPRMRLVDAVDAMADNRGELLFELRGATERKFALYRVLRGQADRLFVSGPGTIATEISQETTAKPE